MEEKYKEVAADSAYVYIRDFDYRNNRLRGYKNGFS